MSLQRASNVSPLEPLLSRLDNVSMRSSGNYMARCPAHDDRTPSLSITETDDGTVLVNCFAGCPASDVLSAVGLSLSDLFPHKLEETVKSSKRKPRHPASEVLKAMAHEVAVVHIIGNQIERELLGAVERERLDLALRRIHNALEFANGR